MRWLAIHLPLLPLEVLIPGQAGQRPAAVYERQRGRICVRLCNLPAAESGVMPGMSPDAARACLGELQLLERRPDLEQAALEKLAVWASRFTPMVVVEPPRGLLLEVAASLRLFGGARGLRATLTQDLLAQGHQAVLCQAPTAGGALLLARAGVEEDFSALEHLRTRLQELPLGLLPLRSNKRKLLADMGLVRLGELLKLPRQGLRQRLGNGFVDYLERVLGEAADLRKPFVPAAGFQQRLELPCEMIQRDALLHAASRLTQALADYLLARQLGVRSLTWLWWHDAPAPTRLEVHLRECGRDAARFDRLLAERLSHTPLLAPVREIELQAPDTEPLHACDQPGSLFPELGLERQREQEVELLERLRARLGSTALRPLPAVIDHRPESFGDSAPNLRQEGPERPLWLLSQPQPLEAYRGRPYRGGRLMLEAERERIESGWWDGGLVRRDYFVAHATNGDRLWIFRDLQGAGGWFLQGVFG